MSDTKIIAVVGATGAQGGGLVRAILRHPSGGFTARAITRDVNSRQGARRWPLWAPRSWLPTSTTRASLRTRVCRRPRRFCVTFFWEHFSPEKEMPQARNMAQAAKAAGVKHVIWSTLEDTRNWVPLTDDRMPTLMGKYKVPHFDAKGESDRSSPTPACRRRFC